MKVFLHRRHGSHAAGESVSYDEVTGQWLVDHGFGVVVGDPRTKEQYEGDLTPTHSTRPMVLKARVGGTPPAPEDPPRPGRRRRAGQDAP